MDSNLVPTDCCFLLDKEFGYFNSFFYCSKSVLIFWRGRHPVLRVLLVCGEGS